jgi:hypothetical protein
MCGRFTAKMTWAEHVSNQPAHINEFKDGLAACTDAWS